MLVRTLKTKILIKHENQTDHFPLILHLYQSQLNEPKKFLPKVKKMTRYTTFNRYTDTEV